MCRNALQANGEICKTCKCICIYSPKLRLFFGKSNIYSFPSIRNRIRLQIILHKLMNLCDSICDFCVICQFFKYFCWILFFLNILFAGRDWVFFISFGNFLIFCKISFFFLTYNILNKGNLCKYYRRIAGKLHIVWFLGLKYFVGSPF